MRFLVNRLATCGIYLKEIDFTSLVCFQFEVHTLHGVIPSFFLFYAL